MARLLHAHTTRLRERISYLDRVLAAADAMADDLRDGNRTTATQNVAAYDAIRISLFAPPAAPDAPDATPDRSVSEYLSTICGAFGHPIFKLPCDLPPGHQGPHDNGSGSPWPNKKGEP